MTERIIKNDRIGEQYYCYEHESGLEIALYPMSGYSMAYAMFGTKYGSIDATFKTNKDEDFITVPSGIAHFLEHKLFESEDGDAFSLFAKTGASANAYTSFEKTCYLFSTTANFEESLQALMSFVQAPYFTKETVDKEQGIIGQEIKMFEDNPGWRVFFNLLSGMYLNSPVKIDIAGTVESIAQIDKDLLYRCYDTFYNLNNMMVTIAGNFDVSSAREIIEKSLKFKEKITIERKEVEEPTSVAQEKITQKLEVSIPLFNFGYKQPPIQSNNVAKSYVMYEIITCVLASSSSELYKELYDEGLVDAGFGSELFNGRGYTAYIFAGESKEPDKVKGKIIAATNRLKASGIDESSFLRAKKELYGRCVSDFNQVEEVANSLFSAHFNGCTIYDVLEESAVVSLADVNELLKTTFAEENTTLSVILPNK